MERRFLLLTLSLAILAVFFLLLVFIGMSICCDGNDLDLSKAEAGDIIAEHGTRFGLIIPGYWDHIAVYIGDGKIVEATDIGVVVSNASNALSSSETILLRVNATKEQKERAIEFMLEQLGKNYDIFWLTKEINGSHFYCSELVWAGYKMQGIDIDANPEFTWQWGNAVSPTEIAEDDDVYEVAYGK